MIDHNHVNLSKHRVISHNFSASWVSASSSTYPLHRRLKCGFVSFRAEGNQQCGVGATDSNVQVRGHGTAAKCFPHAASLYEDERYDQDRSQSNCFLA